MVLAVTVVVFNQTSAPLLFLVLPFLMLVAIQIDLGWAAICILMVALVGGWFSVHQIGPVGVSGQLNGQWRSALLQLFLASALFMLYTVSMAFEDLRKTQKQLTKIAALHKLVVDNSRDIIILGNLEGRRDYVSPGVKALSGWSPEDLEGRLFQDLIHPTDLPEVEMALRAMQAGSPGGTLEYRIRKRDGNFLWVEANMRVYRDPATGLPTGFLNLVRDVSERKRAEENLQTAYRAMETLVVVDALTGIANRRRFDDVLASEWRRSLRLGNRLSMLLVDVDHFKAYNDTYGHVRGDSCLKQIAEAALDVVVRPADLVARYGGEEFAVVLPGTDEIGAQAVAEEICRAVRNRKLIHATNPHGIVTVSVGCATVMPQRGMSPKDLIEISDKALYEAKGRGRNQVVVALPQSTA
jgi:diguanylate cyclase (GGDEF)-like protein/PAS domain S-box-containing protein